MIWFAFVPYVPSEKPVAITLVRGSAQAGHIGARELANMAYGAAHCGRGRLLGLLFEALARLTSLFDKGAKGP